MFIYTLSHREPRRSTASRCNVALLVGLRPLAMRRKCLSDWRARRVRVRGDVMAHRRSQNLPAQDSSEADRARL